MKELSDFFNPTHKATSVKLSERSIRSYVKGPLKIVWTEEALSAHGGLELFSRYLAGQGWPRGCVKYSSSVVSTQTTARGG